MQPMMKRIVLATTMFAAMAFAADNSCQATITADAQLVASDLSAISAQAKAQQFPQAVERLAADLETIVPTLSRPDQALVEKYLTDLSAAVSSTGPGGTSITAIERIILTNDLSAIAASTGITDEQLQAILDDLLEVSASLSGISTAQLQSDLQKLRTDVQACRVQ